MFTLYVRLKEKLKYKFLIKLLNDMKWPFTMWGRKKNISYKNKYAIDRIIFMVTFKILNRITKRKKKCFQCPCTGRDYKLE